MAYGIPDVTVDGNDVIAVYEAVHEALSRARKGAGPTLIECKTYRWHGHYEGDRQTYKPKEEIEDWIRRDPIPAFRNKLVENQILTFADSEKIGHEIEAEIENAVKFALESPYPSPEDTLQDVFAEGGSNESN
jgi:TPP-dependent pyruvate/acetoin dehydrogenase alpha subunit